MMDSDALRDRFQAQKRAYQELARSSDLLLAGHLYWTERILLRLVRVVARQRLAQISAVAPAALENHPTPGPDFRPAMMEAMAEAALGGHELGQWKVVEHGYQATCQRCGMTTWLGNEGLRYSLLEDSCQ
jgi:hypothetical protein